jgi:hypothetical protein
VPDIAGDEQPGAAKIKVLLIALFAGGGVLGPIGPKLALKTKLKLGVFILDDQLRPGRRGEKLPALRRW